MTIVDQSGQRSAQQRREAEILRGFLARNDEGARTQLAVRSGEINKLERVRGAGLKPPKIKKRPLPRLSQFFLGFTIIKAQLKAFPEHIRTISREAEDQANDIAAGYRSADVEDIRRRSDAHWERMQAGADLMTSRYYAPGEIDHTQNETPQEARSRERRWAYKFVLISIGAVFLCYILKYLIGLALSAVSKLPSAAMAFTLETPIGSALFILLVCLAWAIVTRRRR